MNSISINWQSLRAKTTLLSVMLIAVFFLVGAISINKLNQLNSASAEIRDHWLESTRLVGDLNNYTSDYRSLESGSLITTDKKLLNDTYNDSQNLSYLIDRAQKEYSLIDHNRSDREAFNQFKKKWDAYEKLAKKVINLSNSQHKIEANEIFLGESNQTYIAATNSLNNLNNLTVNGARYASEDAENIYYQAHSLMLIIIGLSFVGIAFILHYIRAKVALPLLKLANDMHLIATNNVDIQITGLQRQDEIGAMARATEIFKKNTLSLYQRQLGLIEETEQLSEKLLVEQKINELQSNFVSMISHEFRTPLMIIDGQAQRLIKLRKEINEKDIHDRALRIRMAILRLTNVINEITATSRLQDQNFQFPFKPTKLSIGTVVKDVCNTYEQANDDRLITVEIESNLSEIFADYSLMFLAITNLISNALKYSKPQSHANIKVKKEAQDISISIEDQGIGVPSQDLERIFDRYQRGSNSATISGSGIGLYLVKMVAEMHRGSVSVKSVEGKGSTFTLVLPIIQTSSG
jgi:signal transduction histidine kinase